MKPPVLNNLNNVKFPQDEPANSMNVLGICLGATSISLLHLERTCSVYKKGDKKDSIKIRTLRRLNHEGNPKQALFTALREINPESFDRIAVTGRKFCNFINLSSIREPEAVEYAYQFSKPEDVTCPAVVSAGGETFMIYVMSRTGRISNVITGNKCASGTGEFFVQQLRRMDVSMDEAAQFAAVEKPHQVSGRCSVFCKSDCTHAINAGIPKAKITAGLCKMMANKILELLKKTEKRNIMLTGGTVQNHMMVDYLKQEIPGLVVPESAPYFEALGAALWALEHETLPYPGTERLFIQKESSFQKLPELNAFSSQVEFKSMKRSEVRKGDRCIIGLDVGSTTTKAVLLRSRDKALCASVYLRTNGDPVGASRKCYASLLSQISRHVEPDCITIQGLGVTGSGRRIAGLHGLTDGVINEIIAHASAAVYFDPAVDTIFEIGGQDAKYTYITNSVPSDYAMNEACSAGTGSFLEEAALENLGIRTEDIAGTALKGDCPPNFNDQCAAFISSDIKNAIHEGAKCENIVAGLVYSICMNYSNRVKGHRPVGKKVFMQGGVCYNRAVPLAMASLTGKPIIVPPEPGLMGAFGVALEIKRRLHTGALQAGSFDLQALIDRQVKYDRPFICKGGKEKCDRRCEVSVIRLEGKKIPFGGACNRYYNLRKRVTHDVRDLDLVQLRQKLVFQKYSGKLNIISRRWSKGKIAFNRSFLVHTYYPLYSTFFAELGFEPVLAETCSQKGIDHRNAPFCYPAELSHGFFYSLITMEPPPDFLFLPHFQSIPAFQGHTTSKVCPFIQGEPFFLKTTFRNHIERLSAAGIKVVSPLLDMTAGMEDACIPLIECAEQMGVPQTEAEAAFRTALQQQRACMAEMKAAGRRFLSGLEEDAGKTAVVLFGRPYNGFADEANMGIPRKFASRGVPVIPCDFLPFENEKGKHHMFWGMGQIILKAAEYVKRHPQLFGAYVTNFSCGPDSFILGYFRDRMGRKPSLTIELDSHTADTGIETRIEAFLDIVSAYRKLAVSIPAFREKTPFRPARIIMDRGVAKVINSRGESLPLTHPRVTMLLPQMGGLMTSACAAAVNSVGIRTVAPPIPDESILKRGRANTSCKECLPLILTTGILLDYVENEKRNDEVLVYFMPTANGPCRFGQYYVFMEDLVEKQKIPNVAMLALTAENSYAGLGADFHKRIWWAVVISDVVEDIRSMILANASDRESAVSVFNREWNLILDALQNSDYTGIEQQLMETSERLKLLPMKKPVEEVPVITLSGEIYVRRESLSRRFLTEHLAERGIACICSPVAEWLHFTNYLLDQGLDNYSMTQMEKLQFFFKKTFMSRYEKRIKSILNRSGLVQSEPLDLDVLIREASPYISPRLTSETVLTIGGVMHEIASKTCGVIAIGPFGCMPNRLAEAILHEITKSRNKLAVQPGNRMLKMTLADFEDLPFFAIESDGSPFPQIIYAKLDAFCLQARRLHLSMLHAKQTYRKRMSDRNKRIWRVRTRIWRKRLMTGNIIRLPFVRNSTVKNGTYGGS
jgi:predicted CoA-substrate-specific enzyme activase